MPSDTIGLMAALLMLGAILTLAVFLVRAAGPEAQRRVLWASGQGLAAIIAVSGVIAIILRSRN
jgi:hypothetical protein